MRPSARGLATLATVLGAVGALVAGCNSAPSGEIVVSKSGMEASVAQLFRERVGREPIHVTCPGGLRAHVSGTEDCQVLTNDDRRYRVVLTVTRVDSSQDVVFDLHVGAQLPNLITADD